MPTNVYLQIIPADGWWVLYEMEDGKYEKSKIVAIALHKEGYLVFLGTPEHSPWLCEDATEPTNCRGIFYEGSKELEGL